MTERSGTMVATRQRVTDGPRTIRRYIPMASQSTPASRFWSKVNFDGPVPSHAPHLGKCWLWTGATDPLDYGTFWNGTKYVKAYRWAYEFCIRTIPDGLSIDHLCRTPSCVNPDHLEAVSLRENILRGTSPTAKNAAKTHCPQGHPYNVENTYHNPARVERKCRVCGRAQAAKRAKADAIVHSRDVGKRV